MLITALDCISSAIDNAYSLDISFLWRWNGYIKEALEYDDAARDSYILALEGAEDSMAADLHRYIDNVEDKLKDDWDNYTTYTEYKDRKYILIVPDRKIGGCFDTDIKVFRDSNIPSCIKFYDGLPLTNELYMGHPFNPEVYVPFEQAEEFLFLDKVQEFCYILQCLGAEEITITSVKGKKVEEMNSSQDSLNIEGKAWFVKGEFEKKDSSVKNFNSTSADQYEVRYMYDPMDLPFVPNDIVWYQNQPKWQRLAQSRIQGNTLEYSESLSTKDSRFTSSSEKNEIRGKLKVLKMKISGSKESDIEKQLKEETETEWRISVKFRSKKYLVSDSNVSLPTTALKAVSSLTDNEQKLLNEIKSCLEDDGIIDSNEEKYLEKFRERLGISSERAKELRNSLEKPVLSSDEEEYALAYIELLENGRLPQSSEKIVMRYRKLYNVSDERAKFIEKFALE